MIDVVDVDDDDALTTAVQPVPAPPVDLTWNPKSDDDHLQTYVWIHKPDISFVLREKLPGHVVDAEEEVRRFISDACLMVMPGNGHGW